MRTKSIYTLLGIGISLVLGGGSCSAVHINFTEVPQNSSSLTVDEKNVEINNLKEEQTEGMLGNFKYVWPTTARTITQYPSKNHLGIDIAGDLGDPIYAVQSGKVEESVCGLNEGYGCMIILDHGNGIKTMYAHNSKLLVEVNEEVKIGQKIAEMGNSGQVYGRTGVHLHFELRVGGVRVNPLDYIKLK